MLKATWIYVTIALVVIAGGGAYLYSRQVTSVEVTEPSLPIQSPTAVGAPSRDDEEIKRRTLEGIGSVKQLRPVPITPAPSK